MSLRKIPVNLDRILQGWDLAGLADDGGNYITAALVGVTGCREMAHQYRLVRRVPLWILMISMGVF
jgi:hypothetical protein